MTTSPSGDFDAILAAAQAGDGRAFEQLYTALNRRVHAYVRTRGAADPEGVVNEVFLSVFTRIGSFEGGENQFNAWVFTIARNKLVDEARRRQRSLTVVSSDSCEGLLHGYIADEVSQDALIGLANASLAERLTALTDDQRDVVLLRVVADMSIDMIAEALGRSPGAVKALLRRAYRTIERTGMLQAVPQ